MSTPIAAELAEHVIITLRAHEAELRQAGIRHLRRTVTSTSRLSSIRQPKWISFAWLPSSAVSGAPLGRPVEILPAPVENPRLRANVERDRLIAFQEQSG